MTRSLYRNGGMIPPCGIPPDCVSMQEIHARNRPGLPIRQVDRINFLQKGGTSVHPFPERRDTAAIRESGLFPQSSKNINRH